MGSMVEVCWSARDPDADLAPLARILSPRECARAARFHFSRDRWRYITARARLRELLARRLDCAPAEVPLDCNAYGKPFVPAGDLRFNLSHAGDVTLYVLAQGRDVGCDIEWRNEQVAVDDVAARFFAAREVDVLRGLPAAERTAAFFNGWTRKEAFIKALGLGLSVPLDGFEVSLAPGEPAAFVRGGAGWSIHAFEPLPGLHAAIVARGSAPIVTTRPE